LTCAEPAMIFPGVNTGIVGRIPSALAICVALAGCASNTHVVSMGNNTYTITREAVTVFSRDTEALKAEAKEDAAKFCASKGKQLKVVDITAEKPRLTTGYAKAKIVFQAVDAVDSSPTVAPATVDLLYAELIKLDELRKRSILTEEEFQAEKKKVLNRSK
jgi:hypothetical protein